VGVVKVRKTIEEEVEEEVMVSTKSRRFRSKYKLNQLHLKLM
jgi:hypothetical protein